MSMNRRPKYPKEAQNGKIFAFKEGVLFYQIIDTLLHMHNMNSQKRPIGTGTRQAQVGKGKLPDFASGAFAKMSAIKLAPNDCGPNFAMAMQATKL